MRILIAEQAHSGHYYTYVRYLLQAIRETGDVEIVLAVSREGLASDEFRIHLADVVDRVDVLPILNPVKYGPAGVLSAAGNLRTLNDAVKPDALYFPSGDWIAQTAGIARFAGCSPVTSRMHSEILVNRLSFTYAEYGTSLLKRRLSLAALELSPWSTIHLTDVLAYQWLHRHGNSLHGRLHLIPDPVEDAPSMTRDEARLRLKIPEEGRYITCAGVIDSRKGIGPLVQAFASAELPASDRLLLAGPIEHEVRPLLESSGCEKLRRSQRLILIDRVMSTEDMSLALSASDVVACTYPRQPHPVSMAARAMARRRPVLGSNNYWLKEMISLLGMGWTVNIEDPDAYRKILPRVLDAAASWTLSETGERFVKWASVDNFKACWSAGLREKIGLPSTPTRLSWDWVMGRGNG